MEKMYYPNPAFERDEWQPLNGMWEFQFDDDDIGLRKNWQNRDLELKIRVPFVYQSEMSNLSDSKGNRIEINAESDYHPVLWYRRKVDINSINKNTILNFNAVDYSAMVWVNDHMVTTHVGGYSPFSIDISAYVKYGENTIVVRCEDYHDPAQPRGKQIWTDKHWGCWYAPSSGIWQDVWLSFSDEKNIASAMITPDLDKRMAHFEIEYSKKVSQAEVLEIQLDYNGKLYQRAEVSVEKYRQNIHLHISQPNQVDDKHAWSPESPSLFYVTLLLKDCKGNILDKVKTYFGMRKISTRNGQILLNNRPLYQRLILDQAYWPESLITPPSKEALRKDLELIKALGFNGLRMHQKFEDPWLYYLASEMGLVVWAELPSAYRFSFNEVENVTRDMLFAVKSLYNNPSIITWVPFNESWGIRDVFTDKEEQNFVMGIYYLIKSVDPIRLISGNDGWEQVVTDFAALHDYDIYDNESYEKKWSDKKHLFEVAPCHRQSYAEGFEYKNEPVILTEFGGIALEKDASGDAWGYRSPAKDEDELLERLRKLMEPILNDDQLAGFCYTQLTDVQQEVNGLLYPDRRPKCNVDDFASIFNPRRA